MRLFHPLVSRIGDRQEHRTWQSLKALLEDTGGVATTQVRHPDRARRIPGWGPLGPLWGASESEQVMALPGDEVISAPALVATHAPTIDALPEEVWPWLVQLGHGRAGFYTDSRLWDRFVDCYYRLLAREQAGGENGGYHVAVSERIVPVWQHP